MTDNKKEPHWELITVAAAAMLMVTMGARQSLGLFVSPLNASTALGIMTISFAMGVGQFVWGAVQPIAGAVTDRYGAGRVLAAGVLILALGSALTPFINTGLGLVLTIGLLSGHWLRRSQLLGVDRRGGATPSAAGSWHGRRHHQRRRVIRTVHLRAFAANIDRRLGLDGRDVVSSGYCTCSFAPRTCIARIASLCQDYHHDSRGRRLTCNAEAGPCRPQLSAAACWLFHLRLPHRVSRHASAG